jgi:hypothetical protein
MGAAWVAARRTGALYLQIQTLRMLSAETTDELWEKRI